jgi:hypothetical protein
MFVMPDTYNEMKADGQPKSKNTIAMYKTHLNKISNATGFSTIAEFTKNSKKVIKAIDEICPQGNESDVIYRSKKRVYYSALFMVLPPEVLAKKNAFYLANKKVQDGKPSSFKKVDGPAGL